VIAPVLEPDHGGRDAPGYCAACGSCGRVGASCDACVRAAYQAAILRGNDMHKAAESMLARAVFWALHDALIAGLVGHDVIRGILPGARMQAPEVPS
jgi:hypothetical protein